MQKYRPSSNAYTACNVEVAQKACVQCEGTHSLNLCSALLGGMGCDIGGWLLTGSYM